MEKGDQINRKKSGLGKYNYKSQNLILNGFVYSSVGVEQNEV